MYKLPLTLGFIFIIVLNGNAQLSTGKEKFSDKIINQLKATTTVFFYSKDQGSQIDSIKEALSDGWKLTPLIFDDILNFDKYATDPKYSYFVIEGLSTTTTTSTGGYSNVHYWLALRLFKDVNRKGKISTTSLCRIELYPNTRTLFMGGRKRDANEVIEELYKKGVFYNWTPILLKAQLEVVSTNLSEGIKPGLFENTHERNLEDILSADTLYVPERLLMSFNGFTGKEAPEDENVFADYSYKYKICTDSELFDIFQKQKRGRLLFEYVKSSTDKFITVYDLKEKKVIYKDYTPVSYNLKSKDIRRIN